MSLVPLGSLLISIISLEAEKNFAIEIFLL